METVIIGAGISGLTCALELAKKGIKVIIYEIDKIPGGMAKSYRINNIPSEHSWRGYMSFYYNTFDILQQLKCNKIEHYSNDKLYTAEEVKLHNKHNDAWIIYRGYIYDITYFINKHPGGSLIKLALGKDVEKVWNKYFASWHLKNSNVIKRLTKNKIGKLQINENFTCKSTLKPITIDKLYNKKPKYDKLLEFKQYCNFIYQYSKFYCGNLRNKIFYNTSLLQNFKPKSSLYDNFVTYIAGPGLGLDLNNASIGHIFFYITGYIKNIFDKYAWFVTDRPTNEAFIDPLVELVKSYGVRINYNCQLKKINIKDNKITSILVNDQLIPIDNCVLAINPNMISDILINSNKNHDFDQLIDQFNKLRIINNQISFRLGFNKKIKFDKLNRGYVLMDSINNITFYTQDNFIKESKILDSNLRKKDKKIKSLWSGTCVQSYNSDNKNKFIKKIIDQFIECTDLQKQIYKNNNFYLTKEDIIYQEIFDEWKEINDRLVSIYPKFVNTYLNEQYKPNQITKFDNLYLAGAHTNTSFKIWSMEAACESGKIVANLLLNKYNKPLCKIYQHKPINISKIDDLLYKFGLPSIIDLIILLLFIIIIIYYVKKRGN